ncbi:MAG: hypothetical protein GY845_15060 [Planctomycetes bacterium]|nr:hypothetical protein [Planctomycetota bacterium]
MNDSWSTCWDDPIFDGRSLEADVDAGDTWERDQRSFSARVSINSCPQMIRESVLWLKKKHKDLNSSSSVTRYATRNGITVIQRIPEIKTIRVERRKAYEAEDRLRLMNFSGHTYDFGHRLSVNNVALKCSVFTWVDGAIVDIADDLGLPASTIALLALVAGLAQSVNWIPRNHKAPMIAEINRFHHSYLADRVSELNIADQRH